MRFIVLLRDTSYLILKVIPKWSDEQIVSEKISAIQKSTFKAYTRMIWVIHLIITIFFQYYNLKAICDLYIIKNGCFITNTYKAAGRLHFPEPQIQSSLLHHTVIWYKY